MRERPKQAILTEAENGYVVRFNPQDWPGDDDDVREQCFVYQAFGDADEAIAGYFLGGNRYFQGGKVNE